MADEIDLANERAEIALADALRMRKPVLPRIGHCYNCGERADALYCDVACRDDHQRRQFMQSMAPR
jgi:hypothetical protein